MYLYCFPPSLFSSCIQQHSMYSKFNCLVIEFPLLFVWNLWKI